MRSILFILIAATSLAFAKPPLIIAHRGASGSAPENTLAAFNLAWEEGADGIEGDFYLTSDGEVVAFHDKTTKRTAGVDLPVKGTPWSTLSKLDVGSWKDPKFAGERPPLLGEVLDALPPGKRFFIEIKDGVEIVEPIRKILAEKKADPQQVILIAFSAEVVRACRKVIPEFQSHWLSSLKDIDKPDMADRYVADLKQTGASGLQFQATAPISAEWIRKLAAEGYSLTAWTINDADLARRMIDLGMDHITTDHPAQLRRELGLVAVTWNVRDHIALEEFIIQSHRGAGELAPENSKETFELAWSLGTIPEADLRTTSDGVIVAFHDNNFARMLPDAPADMKAKGIEHLTWDEVRQLDIGAWKGPEFTGQRIPSLAEVFELLNANPRRRIYVDIKNVDLRQLADEAHAAGVAERLILASTKPEIIREWKSQAPDSFTLHWMGGTEAALGARLETLAKEDFAGIDQLQIHVKPVAGGFEPSPEFLAKTGAELRSRGILFQTLPWQIRGPEIYAQLLDLGVASFATDFPDVAAAAVRSYYSAK
jgi:glycerophosphoryl diester phosphodiesterase